MTHLSDMTRRKFITTLLTTAAAAAASSRLALGQEGGVTLPIISDKKFDGVEVVVESQSGPVISGPVQIFGPIWEKATGAKINLVTYPFGQMFEKLRTEFASGAYTADLINVQTTWAGDFMGGGFVDEVPEDVLKLANIDDYYPSYRNAMTWAGKTQGLVYDGNVHNMFYRRDLFENADHKKKFADAHGYELEVPKTWEKFFDVAKFFRSFDWSGTGQSYGFVEPMGRGTGGVYFLIGRGLSYAKKEGDPYAFFNPEDMSPRISEPGWIQALEDWKRDSVNGPPGIMQYGFSESRPTFVSGQAAMITDWGDIGTLSYSKDSKVKGKTGTALVPGGSKVYDRVKKDWAEAPKRRQPCALSRRDGLAVLCSDDGGEQGGGLGSRSLPVQSGSLIQAGRLSGFGNPAFAQCDHQQSAISDRCRHGPSRCQGLSRSHRAGHRPSQCGPRSAHPRRRRILQCARCRSFALYGRRNLLGAGDEERDRRVEPHH